MKRFVRERSGNGTRNTIVSVVLFTGIVVIFLLCIGYTGRQTKEEQKLYLEEAIQRCMMQCYAIEGRYPESLTYIEENYGLIYDKETFFIDYRVVGSNLKPEVEVLEMREKE